MVGRERPPPRADKVRPVTGVWRGPAADRRTYDRPVRPGSGCLVRVSGALALVALLVGAYVGYQALRSPGQPAGPACRATAGGVSYGFDAEQGANATTVAAVGKRLGLADHAVTVALAAALQESKLHNLAHGDLDSLGLFQQRPSQGWGTPAQVMTPRYAAAAFFRRLAQVPDWQTLSVTDAAQAVQRSAAPGAYAQWDPQARVLAQALTGEVAAAFACRAAVAAPRPTQDPFSAARSAAMTAEIGAADVGPSVSVPRGWLIASWLIGHARQYGVASVTFGGQRWTADRGAWVVQPPEVATGTDRVQINT